MTQQTSHRRRPATGFAGGLLCLCLALLAAGCDEPKELARADTEREANRIIVELANHGIKQANKVETKESRKVVWTIMVPPADLENARKILVANDLPRPERDGFKGLLSQSGMIPTKSEERAKFIYATTEELARTFETYDGVVAARVHIVLPEKDPLRREPTTRPTASASVLIKYLAVDVTPDTPSGRPGSGLFAEPEGTGASARPGKPIYIDAPIRAKDVQKVVARSVEGLNEESVFVTYSPVPALRSDVVAPVGGAAAGAATDTAKPASDDKRLIQLLAIAAVFGVITIVLIVLLVREKRRQRQALAAGFGEPV